MRPAKKQKQIVQILEAIANGCEHTRDLWAETGMQIGQCSSYVRNLIDDGYVRHTGKTFMWGQRGPPFHLFELTEAGRTLVGAKDRRRL